MSTTLLSGIQDIDALLFGTQWGGPVTYQFGQPLDGYPLHDADASTPVPLTAVQKAAFRDVLGQVSQLTGLSLTETTLGDPRDIYIANTGSEATGLAAYPLSFYLQPLAGDIELVAGTLGSPALGTLDRQAFQVAAGSVLGLKIATVPQDWGLAADVDPNPAVLDASKASFEFTSMLSKEAGSGGYPQSWMMLDIQALQYLYGADYTTNAGDTYYGFSPVTGGMIVDTAPSGVPKLADGVTNSNILFRTLWDGGGRDRYDFSAYDASYSMSIDLRPGGWTDVDVAGNRQAALIDAGTGTYARGQVYNALLAGGDTRSLIEIAIGGQGDNLIVGNAADNLLVGWNGNDVLRGLEGDDTLQGNGGNDLLIQGLGGGTANGGPGNDILRAGSGADALNGGPDTDTADYSDSDAPVWVALGGKVTGGHAANDVLTDIESVTGSDFDDFLFGNALPNVLSGGKGNDGLSGLDGADAIHGNDGDDTINGGSGPDAIDGGAGVDTVTFDHAVSVNLATGVHTGEAVGDVYVNVERFSGSGAGDEFIGGTLAVEFLGGGGNDRLIGGAGRDLLQGGQGDDVIDGGPSFDLVSYADAPAGIVLTLGPIVSVAAGAWGTDQLWSIEGAEGSAWDDQLTGNVSGDALRGLDGNDRLVGRGGNDSLLGGPGDDVVLPGTGGDVADGGEGIDTVSYEDQLNGVTVDLGVVVNQSTVAAGSDRLSNFENLTGGLGNDTLKGTNGANTLRGGPGRDVLEGLLGHDALYGEDGDDTLRPSLGNDLIDGGTGVDLLSYLGVNARIVVDLQLTVPQPTGAGLQTVRDIEHVAGSFDNDVLIGNAGPNRLIGNQGNDVLEGGAGADVLEGGVGNDTLRPGIGGDIVSGGDGTDLVSYRDVVGVTVDLAIVTQQFTGAGGSDIITGVENAAGGVGNDTLRGDAGANVLYGNLGSDTLQGREGDDSLYGEGGDDTLLPGAGDDLIDGGDGIDLVSFWDLAASVASGVVVDLSTTAPQNTGAGGLDRIVNVEGAEGGPGWDVLIGNDGPNVLIGNGGNDVLRGGGGIDRLVGGPGADRFVFGSLDDFGATGELETIVGYDRGLDIIDLSAIDWSSAPGRQGLRYVETAFTGAGEVRFEAGRLLFNLDADLATAERVIAIPGVSTLGVPGGAPARIFTSGSAADHAGLLLDLGPAGDARDAGDGSRTPFDDRIDGLPSSFPLVAEWRLDPTAPTLLDGWLM